MISTKRALKPIAIAFFLIAAIPLAVSLEAEPTNENSRSLMNVDTVHEDGFTGQGTKAAMWGFGLAGDHTDLESNNGLLKVDSGDVSGHPTHVAGIVSGQGLKDSSKKGVAPDAKMLSYTLETSSTDQLISETLDAQSKGAVVSHNSWAWMSKDRHGNYDSFSRTYDKLVRGTASGQEEGITVVFPSANHRNDVDRDYNTIPGTGSTAKNSITVGAVDRQGDMTSFSSWGPTDTGRIKPDLMANGQFVESTLPGDNYGYKRGTSVAAPAVSGAVVLVNNAYEEEKGKLPDPATVKAVLIHNAEDLSTEGPDYRTGWGIPDVEDSVQHVRRDSNENVIEKGKLTDPKANDSYTADFSSRGQGKITLVWSDQAGSDGGLVNDLDLDVRDSSGNELDSWSLDSSNPDEAATKGEDHTNTVEQVEVPQSEGQIEITVESDSLEDSQSYSLVTDSPLAEKKEQVIDNSTKEDAENSTQSGEETVNETQNETETTDSEKITPELNTVSPVKKTYRTNSINFKAQTEDLSELKVDLNGESYSLERKDEDIFSREIKIENGFQTATFRAIAENGDRLESSIFFYAITGSETVQESDSENQDSQENTSDTENTETGNESDDSSSEDTDSSTDETANGDEETSGSEDTTSGETDSEDSDTSDSSSDSSGTENTDSADNQGPQIEIISPKAGQDFNGKTLFKVQYSEEVSSAQLTLNRRNTYDLQKNGDYYTGEFSLEEGLNTMMFMGTDMSGNFNSETLTVRN